QAEHVAAARADARDVVARAVEVRLICKLSARVAVAEDHAVFAQEFFVRLVVADVVAFGVRDGEAQDLARAQAGGEGRLGRLDADVDVLADEVKLAVSYERAGQKPRLA